MRESKRNKITHTPKQDSVSLILMILLSSLIYPTLARPFSFSHPLSVSLSLSFSAWGYQFPPLDPSRALSITARLSLPFTPLVPFIYIPPEGIKNISLRKKTKGKKKRASGGRIRQKNKQGIWALMGFGPRKFSGPTFW